MALAKTQYSLNWLGQQDWSNPVSRAKPENPEKEQLGRCIARRLQS